MSGTASFESSDNSVVRPAPPSGLSVGVLVGVRVPEPGLLRGRPPRPPHPGLVFIAAAFVFVVVLALREVELGTTTWLIMETYMIWLGMKLICIWAT